MGNSRKPALTLCFAALVVVVLQGSCVDAQPLVPALFIFGDSTVDVGNNNYLFTLVKSNFPPLWQGLRHRQSHWPLLRWKTRHWLCWSVLQTLWKFYLNAAWYSFKDPIWSWLWIFRVMSLDIERYDLGYIYLCICLMLFFGDFAAETLGFTSFPPAYLSPQASGQNLLTGVNFASGASDIYDDTAQRSVSTGYMALNL